MVSTDRPYVPVDQKITITDHGYGIYRIVAAFGFMETPSIQRIIQLTSAQGLPMDLQDISFYLGPGNLVDLQPGKMATWRKALFYFPVAKRLECFNLFRHPAGPGGGTRLPDRTVRNKNYGGWFRKGWYNGSPMSTIRQDK